MGQAPNVKLTAKEFVAKQTIAIDAPIQAVWDALVNPNIIKEYMFGTNVVSNWKEGSQIIFEGEWKGKRYEDRGVILLIKPEQLIRYTHFSPLSGLSDALENYHTVTIELSKEGPGTLLSLIQDNNATKQARDESEKNWGSMLITLKKILEK